MLSSLISMQKAEDREVTELRLLPRGQQNFPHVTQRSSSGVTVVRLLLPFPLSYITFSTHELRLPPSPPIVATTRPSYTMITAGRHTRDRALDAFTDAYNEMQKLYDDDNLKEVYERAQVFLADNASPRYHRVKALLLLSDITSDLDEAQRYYAEAEALWRIVRRQHALGHSGVDTELSHCRKCLDWLADVLESRRAENKRGKAGAEFDPEAMVKDHIAQHEKEVAGIKAAADDEDQLERVNLAILGMAKEESVAILAQKAANRVCVL
jgi:hypothetical protein